MSVAVFRPSTVLPGLGSCAYCAKSIYCAHTTHNCRPIHCTFFMAITCISLATDVMRMQNIKQFGVRTRRYATLRFARFSQSTLIGCLCNNSAFTVITAISLSVIFAIRPTVDNCGADHSVRNRPAHQEKSSNKADYHIHVSSCDSNCAVLVRCPSRLRPKSP